MINRKREMGIMRNKQKIINVPGFVIMEFQNRNHVKLLDLVTGRLFSINEKFIVPYHNDYIWCNEFYEIATGRYDKLPTRAALEQYQQEVVNKLETKLFNNYQLPNEPINLASNATRQFIEDEEDDSDDEKEFIADQSQTSTNSPTQLLTSGKPNLLQDIQQGITNKLDEQLGTDGTSTTLKKLWKYIGSPYIKRK